MEFLNQIKPDYRIMGQHFLGNEYNGMHIYRREGDDILISYVSQVIAGLLTGDFLYLAHPDMIGWGASPKTAQREYRRLCEFAKKKNVPLEINLLGIADNRSYPSREFFKIAAEIGNDVILGVDAHVPSALLNKGAEKQALDMVKDLGLKLIDKPLL